MDSFGFEEKRTALKALKIKPVVTATDVQVRGVLGVEPDLATTARTSAYMCQNDVARIPIEIPLAA